MDEILEYIQAIFERPYMGREWLFPCAIKELASSRCICIPGVAMNYIACIVELCYENMDIQCFWNWKSEQGGYIPEAVWKGKLIAPPWLKDNANGSKSYFFELLCDSPKTAYSYIKIRSQVILKNRNKGGFQGLLMGQSECFQNSGDYLYLFAYIACSYRMEFAMGEYTQRLFRTFFFLFPLEAINVLRKACAKISESPETERSSFKYIEAHRLFLEDYLKLLQLYG